MILAGSTHFDDGTSPILPYLWLASNYILIPAYYLDLLSFGDKNTNVCFGLHAKKHYFHSHYQRWHVGWVYPEVIDGRLLQLAVGRLTLLG